MDTDFRVYYCDRSLGNILGVMIGSALAYPKKLHIANLSDSMIMSGNFLECIHIINENSIKNILICIDNNFKGIYKDLQDIKYIFKNWTIYTLNGHTHIDTNLISSAIQNAKHNSTVLLFDTIKGYGLHTQYMNKHYEVPQLDWLCENL